MPTENKTSDASCTEDVAKQFERAASTIAMSGVVMNYSIALGDAVTNLRNHGVLQNAVYMAWMSQALRGERTLEEVEHAMKLQTQAAEYHLNSLQKISQDAAKAMTSFVAELEGT